jgi:hypothetical protein
MQDNGAFELAGKLAAELGGHEWTVMAEERERNYNNSEAYLAGPDGLRVRVEIGCREIKPGRVGLAGVLPDGLEWPRKAEYARITVAASKSPAAMVKDLTRRLLPTLREVRVLAEQEHAEREADNAAHAELLATLSGIFGHEVIAETRAHFGAWGSLKWAPLRGNAEVPTHGDVWFQLHVQRDHAVAFARLIAAMNAGELAHAEAPAPVVDEPEPLAVVDEPAPVVVDEDQAADEPAPVVVDEPAPEPVDVHSVGLDGYGQSTCTDPRCTDGMTACMGEEGCNGWGYLTAGGKRYRLKSGGANMAASTSKKVHERCHGLGMVACGCRKLAPEELEFLAGGEPQDLDEIGARPAA